MTSAELSTITIRSPPPPPARKRGAPASGSTSEGRSGKRRASRACYSCRTRKVRCNVVEHGPPCTNCRLDEVECVLTTSRRGKAQVSEENINLAQSPPSDIDIDNADDLPVCLTFEDGPRESSRRSTRPTGDDHEESLLCESRPSAYVGNPMQHLLHQCRSRPKSSLPPQRQRQLDGDWIIDSVPDQVPSGQQDHEAMRCLTSSAQFTLPTTSIEPLCAAPNINDLLPASVPNSILNLPPYIRAPHSGIAADDIEFLQRKGAFTVPKDSFRNELLRSYVQYVNPFMPVLDLKQFLTPMARNNGVDPISLLLFHTVMFAGSAFIDLRQLQVHGFETRKAARKAFYTRARLLYDFDYEPNSLALIQSLLLMSYWYESPEDRKHTWHWLGIALSMASTLCLHRKEGHSYLVPAKQRLHKRIWWACVIRDRLIALGMRRPMRIRNEDFDVPMLERADFDTEPLPNELFQTLGGTPCVLNCSARTDLAVTCIELAKLTLCISNVLSSQYSLVDSEADRTSEAGMMLIPKNSAANLYEVYQCEKQLKAWSENLHPESRHQEPDPFDYDSTACDTVIQVHRALLHMIYCTTTSVLYRPQVFRPTTSQTLLDSDRAPRRKLRQAAIEVTKTIASLTVHDQIRFLSTSGVTVLIAAIITHLLDMKSRDPNVRTLSISRLYQCMQALQKLRDVYSSADSAIVFIQNAIRKARINLPTLRLDPGGSPCANAKRPMNLDENSHTSSNPVPVVRESPSRPLTSIPEVMAADAAMVSAEGESFMERGDGDTNQHQRDPLAPVSHASIYSVPHLYTDLSGSEDLGFAGEGDTALTGDNPWDLMSALLDYDCGASLPAPEDTLELHLGF